MHADLIILLLSFSCCIVILFLLRRSLVKRFLDSYSSRIDERFNSANTLHVQAMDTLQRLRDDLDSAKASGEALVEKVTKEMELHLEHKIKEANAVSASQLALVEVSLRRERVEGLKKVESEIKGKIDEVVSASIGVGTSSSGLISGTNLDSILHEVKGRLN